MCKSKLISEAIQQTNDLRHIIGLLKQNENIIRQIDLDLSLEKVRKLYNCLLSLSQVNATEGQETAFVDIPQDAEPDIPIADSVQGEISTGKAMLIHPEETVITNSDKTADDSKSKPEAKPKLIIDLFSGTDSDDASSKELTIAKKISENRQEEILADKIRKTKIRSLFETIGINEKFYFINELFGGNMSEYNQAISSLDQFIQPEESLKSLYEISQLRKWNTDSEAFKQLLELVERKFN
jgi:hypothetical protein